MDLPGWLVRVATAPPPEEAQDDVTRGAALARVKLERSLALVVLASSLMLIYWKLRAAALAPAPNGLDSDLFERMRALQGGSLPPEKQQVLVILGLVFGVGFLLLPVFPALAFIAWRKWAVLEIAAAKASRPPPWGVLLFFVLIVATYAIEGTLAGMVPPPSVHVEQGAKAERTIPLAPGAVVLLGPAAVPKPAGGDVVAIASATSVRARIEREAFGVFLRVEPGMALSAPRVFVNSDPVAEGVRRRLRNGDRVKVDEVVIRIDPMSQARFVATVLIVGPLLATLLAIALARLRGGRARDLGLTLAGAHREVARGVFLVIVALPWVYVLKIVNYFVLRALDIQDEMHPLQQEILGSSDPALVAAIFAAACFAAPLHEEVLFRAVLLRALRWSLSLAPALAIMALAFGCVHPVGTVLPVGGLGALFGLILVTSGRASLLGAIAAHATFNGASLVLGLTVKRLIE